LVGVHTPEAVLRVSQLSKSYRRGHVCVPALRDVSFSLPRGRSVAVMGPSGSGKTSFLNLIAGLDVPSEGSVVISGQDLAALQGDALTTFRRRHIGFVFQFFNLLPTMSAADNVALPLLAERLPLTTIKARTEAMLGAVGMLHRADHRPAEMSGGEQQRVAVARALVMQPTLLLADEPTGNLDSVAGEGILNLLRSAMGEFGLSIVMVTHSYLAASAMDEIWRMQDGALSCEVSNAAQIHPRSASLHLLRKPTE